MTDVVGLSADELIELLADSDGARLGPGLRVSQLDHALQTAGLLQRLNPDDPELAAAGLVHDIGHLLPGGRDETHAEDAAAAVRASLGERVSGIVGLHVEAKRYLVAVESTYGGALSTDSVTSLARQGGAMAAEEVAAFLARPFAADAVTLRKADDLGKDEDAAGSYEPGELERWAAVLWRCGRCAGLSGAERR
jgi:predicted HD phosphohydrolase